VGEGGEREREREREREECRQNFLLENLNAQTLYRKYISRSRCRKRKLEVRPA